MARRAGQRYAPLIIGRRSVHSFVSTAIGPGDSVKTIAEYLEHALHFEKMASEESNSVLKQQFVKQAQAYRKLAAERAERQGLPRPPQPN
jgi:hypothetical protein